MCLIVVLYLTRGRLIRPRRPSHGLAVLVARVVLIIDLRSLNLSRNVLLPLSSFERNHTIVTLLLAYPAIRPEHLRFVVNGTYGYVYLIRWRHAYRFRPCRGKPAAGPSSLDLSLVVAFRVAG